MIKISKACLYISFLLITVGVISNVLCAKLLELTIWGVTFTVSGSTPFFALVFMFSNLLIELEGSRYSKIVVVSNYVCVLISVLMLMIVNHLPGQDELTSRAFSYLFDTNYKFLIASISAYVCSMWLQSKIFRRLRRSFARRSVSRSLSHLTSTVIAQFVDVSIFAFIAYYIGSDWYSVPEGTTMLTDIILSQYAVQLAMIVVTTPIFGIVARRCERTIMLNRI